MCLARQVLIAHGVMRMNEESCDIHDVAKAASDLVAVGCTIGLRHLADGTARLRFSAVVSAYADEVVQAVDEGVISAWEGLQELITENEDLLAKALFYSQNGIGVMAGGMQIKLGLAITAGSGGIGVVPGALLMAHGANNISEGLENIFNGPNAPSAQGPIRRGYQSLFRDSHAGNVAFYTTDLILSGYGVFRMVRKPGSVQLFRYDPISNEKAYRQAGTLTLFFEGLVDVMTLNSIAQEVQPVVLSD